MKKLGWRNLTLVGMLLFATQAFAFNFGDLVDLIDQGQDNHWQPRPPGPGRPDRPDRPGRGEVQCRAQDNGWEEHWGAHRSCHECLAKHGGCTETCERIDRRLACTYDGVRPDGRRVPFTGYGDDRREAEMDAENQCYRSGFRDCRYVRCDNQTQREVILRRQCRR